MTRTTDTQDSLIQRAIQCAAEAIVTTRDFCGNEKEAAEESFYDSGLKPTDDLMFQAQREANSLWRADQKAAGVKPKHWRY